MSTLAYLDEDGCVSYDYVAWKLLNNWLSSINSNKQVGKEVPKGVNRGKLTEELQKRKQKSKNSIRERYLIRGVGRIDRGYGLDWCQYENEDGYTHLEELLIFQPNEWRNQAREYVYHLNFDVERKSFKSKRFTNWITEIDKIEYTIPVNMWSPILVVLFHPEMKRSSRYEPINFLLAYGASDPLPSLYNYIKYYEGYKLKDKTLEDRTACLEALNTYKEKDPSEYNKFTRDSQLSLALVDEMKLGLSPLDYFFHFLKGVQTYSLDVLRQIGKNTGLPRLLLMKELDFSLVVGQRAAKHIIREGVVTHFWNRSNTKDEMCSNFQQPLSMIFAGPSGNGKTELAIWLSKLLNKPDEDAFHKVDCGKITDGRELFGMSGAFHGSNEGSALNNFISCMASENESIGVVLLDEIEKAGKSVIHGLYQVLDKGEWTNKRLEGRRSHTEVISCRNIIFIMTTNAADSVITKYATKNPNMYSADMDDLEESVDDLSFKVQKKLQLSSPFTDAFIGRIGKVVPFLPMGNDESKKEPLRMEMTTVAKLLIERDEENITGGKKDISLKINISPREKDRMADVIVRMTPSESGVRGIQKVTRQKVSSKLMHRCVLEKKQGGIGNGSEVTFSVDKQKNQIRFLENINRSGSFATKEETMGNLVESESESESESEWQSESE